MNVSNNDRGAVADLIGVALLGLGPESKKNKIMLTTWKTAHDLMACMKIADTELDELLQLVRSANSRVFVKEQTTNMKSFFGKYKTSTYYEILLVTDSDFDVTEFPYGTYSVQLYHWGGMKYAATPDQLKAWLLGIVVGLDFARA